MAVAVVAGAILWVLGSNEVFALRSGKPPQREFMAFYTVGYVLNTSPGALYQPDSFLAMYHELFPTAPANLSPVYAHAPFEALLFRPFGLIPYERALVAWQILSLAMICAGVALLWESTGSRPRGYLAMALLLTVSFYPVSVALISRGQAAALTFLPMAIAIWCQRRGREISSGLALAACLSKPTLLVLVLPMLLVGRRVRALAGFIGGAGILAVVSLLAVGWEGSRDYVATVLQFGALTAVRGRSFALPSEYVDLNTFVRLIGGHGPAPMAVLVIATAAVMPCLGRLWRNACAGDDLEVSLAWASTLTWTMILNLYAAVYDTSVIVLGVLLMGDALRRAHRGQVPPAAQALFALLYVMPWIPPLPVGESKVLQVYTLVLIVLAGYQTWLALWGVRGAAADPSGRVDPAVPAAV